MYLFSRPPYQCPQDEGRPFQSGVPGECQMQPQDEERSCHGNCLALFFLLVFKATQKQGTLSTNWELQKNEPDGKNCVRPRLGLLNPPQAWKHNKCRNLVIKKLRATDPLPVKQGGQLSVTYQVATWFQIYAKVNTVSQEKRNMVNWLPWYDNVNLRKGKVRYCYWL